ncbi:MAG: hypothetical protein E6G56_02700 [Actinobacteria bacterium]|nr:MAG: hypothetical protein E6G56_02700 [Actinomycetota bacterium]
MRVADRRFWLALGVLVVVLALAGCGGPNNVAHVDARHISGFWNGLWDGITAVIAFIAHLFGNRANVYEVHNNGGWYNLGFLLGLGLFLGAFSGPRRAQRRLYAGSAPPRG